MARVRCYIYLEARGAEAYVRLMKVKGAVRLYCNEDPAMKMVQEFEERAEEMGRRSMVKEAFKFAEELVSNLISNTRVRSRRKCGSVKTRR